LGQLKQNRKINIVTLGCSKNIVDSEKLMGKIKAGGFEVVHDSEEYDAATVIINTCGFINDAREENIDTILRFVQARQSGKISKLYVMGCLAERYMEELKKEIPEVNRYFGVNNINDILTEIGISLPDGSVPERIITNPGHYAYLKVSEGCDRTCAFCSIPFIRGRYVSRPVGDIVEEAKSLSLRGVKELILVAQDLSYYGLDLYHVRSLPHLLTELLKIVEFEWIRLHYLYPANFPEEVLEVMSRNRRICRYIDIPIQHITDKMLGLMKRSHDESGTRKLLNEVRERLPDAAIRTTLIAGHPGETGEEFAKLAEFVSEFRFDRLGVFAYSHEEGTFSYEKYNDEISREVKNQRVSRIMEIQQSIASGLNYTKIGKVLKVIIDRREGEYFVGRTEYDSPEVDQEVLVSSSVDLATGNFYNIIITGSDEFDLLGVPVT
jgi:ribosomal protein S12 methylthiotransferase